MPTQSKAQHPAEMTHSFRIKGSFFYSADWAKKLGRLTPGASLLLVSEPNNPFDPLAIQVWLARPRLLLGYVPRQQTKHFHFWLQYHLICQLHLQPHPSTNWLWARLYYQRPYWYAGAWWVFKALFFYVYPLKRLLYVFKHAKPLTTNQRLRSPRKTTRTIR